ncbi:MAG TPA: VOC family protein [Mycobacteriales bacterium]|nr:VOC family protein [Mycobacteriales bacterium]
MASWTDGIPAITLFVDDVAAAKRFYVDVFALPVHFEDDESVVFKFGPTLVNLLKATAAPELIEPARVADASHGNRFQLTLQVTDVDTLCEQLQAKGVQLLNGPMDRPWGPRTASFQDPDGHIWEIAT